jgi:hypothetical protein
MIKDPDLPKDRIDDAANDALAALKRIKKKRPSKELRVDVDTAIKDLKKITSDNHHQA